MTLRTITGLAALLVSGALLGLGGASACGGSASETPFPAPPLPDYLEPTAPTNEPSGSSGTGPSATGTTTVPGPREIPATWATEPAGANATAQPPAPAATPRPPAAPQPSGTAATPGPPTTPQPSGTAATPGLKSSSPASEPEAPSGEQPGIERAGDR